MEDEGRSPYERILGMVTAMTLLGALAGGLVLVVRTQDGPSTPRTEFVLSGAIPGRVTTAAFDDPGLRPFTEPVAVDLEADPPTMLLPPLNARAAESPHRRGSAADLLVAGEFGHELVELGDAGATLGAEQIQELADAVLGIDAVVSDLLDVDRDGIDDDGRFSVVAFDGSAVCVTVGPRRVVASAQSLVVDPIDGLPASGVHWTPFGQCGTAVLPGNVSDVRVGTTPGTYGGVRSGEVCDVDALAQALAGNDVVRRSWSMAQSLDPASIEGFLLALTPVVLIRDTLVTDHEFDNGRIIARQAVLQRGTAVLVDRTGMPRVRCISGSPLRRPQPVPEQVEIIGTPWDGFSLDATSDIPPAPRAASRFVLSDIRTGEPLLRQSGREGASAALAGPIVVAAGDE